MQKEQNKYVSKLEELFSQKKKIWIALYSEFSPRIF